MDATNSSRTAELVFVPIPFTGHIMSTVEIAKLLVNRNHGLSITIFLINITVDPNAAAYAQTLVSNHPRVRFIHLPNTSSLATTNASFSSALLRSLVEENKQPLRDAVAKMVSESKNHLAGFVIDILCAFLTEIAEEFSAPSYIYYTSGASVLALTFDLLALLDNDESESHHEFFDLIHSNFEMKSSAFSMPVPIKALSPFFSGDKKFDEARFVSLKKAFNRVSGILVNTFAELESHALESLLHDKGIPPIYPVGPIPNQAVARKEETIINWLDSQPISSVVFLCFGSMGCFDADQITEMAFGIEKSGHRFVWSLRRPPVNGEMNPSEYSNPEEVLPEGFLKRTAEIGKVIGWAPQVEILSHSAVGGFVSHCGWNSVLESLWFGVPMATWPLYAEQQVNALTMARELGLAAEITVEYKRDLKSGKANMLVGREDIERGVKCVMEKESELRRKVKGMKETSRKAVVEGGSSYTWLSRFVEDVMKKIPSS